MRREFQGVILPARLSGTVEHLALAPDGLRFAAIVHAPGASSVVLGRLDRATPDWGRPFDRPCLVAFAPDRDALWVGVGGAAAAMLLLDAGSGDELVRQVLPGDPMLVSPDVALVATVADDRRVIRQIIEVSTGRCRWREIGLLYNRSVHGVLAIFPGEKVAYHAGREQVLFELGAGADQPEREIARLDAPAAPGVWWAGGTRLLGWRKMDRAALTARRRLLVLDEQGRQLLELPTEAANALPRLVAPDGSYAAGFDGHGTSLVVWDFQGRRRAAALPLDADDGLRSLAIASACTLVAGTRLGRLVHYAPLGTGLAPTHGAEPPGDAPALGGRGEHPEGPFANLKERAID